MPDTLEQKQQQFNQAMNLYETKKIYAVFSKIISTINIAGQIIILVFLWNKESSFAMQMLSFIIAYILADFWNGLVHMYMDNNEDYQSFWGPFIASFHLHHRTPKYKKNPVLVVYFNESGSKIWMAPLEILIILLLPKLPVFVAFTVMYFFILSSFAELSHYFCHTIDGKVISFLQKTRIILHKKHHAKHHINDNVNYAFLNGISDPLINVIAKKFNFGYKKRTDRHYETYKGNDTKNR